MNFLKHVAACLAGAALAAGAAQAGVVNGGFETAAVSADSAGSWIDTDSVFGYQRCSYASCGTGGSPATQGPYTGDYWILFGGSDAAQDGLLEQTTAFDIKDVSLGFRFWAGLTGGGAQATLTLSIDGNALWTVTQDSVATYASGHTSVSVPLGAYADGGLHTIRWTYRDDAAGNGVNNINWSLDSVTVTVPEPGSLALAGLALGAAFQARRRRA